jgi:hypothetical protein
MEQVYLQLAPMNLRNYSTARYDGSGFSAALQDFTASDAEILHVIYNKIKMIYDLWLYMKDAPQYSLFKPNVEWLCSAESVNIGKTLGSANEYASFHLRKILHDVRGGALMTMISSAMRISLFDLYHDIEIMRSFVFLARDQAKMMRNAIHDIDIPTRTADERFRIHSVYDYVKKWNHFEYHLEQRTIVIKVRCFYEGNVTTCCLEASALDRVVYNLINNALRFSAGDEIILTIFPIGDVLRWVVENQITPENAAWLQKTVGDNLQALYRGGITNGGNGIGLTNCADLVAASFGVSTTEAIEQGYITSSVAGLTYYACFHWNAVK